MGGGHRGQRFPGAGRPDPFDAAVPVQPRVQVGGEQAPGLKRGIVHRPFAHGPHDQSATEVGNPGIQGDVHLFPAVTLRSAGRGTIHVAAVPVEVDQVLRHVELESRRRVVPSPCTHVLTVNLEDHWSVLQCVTSGQATHLGRIGGPGLVVGPGHGSDIERVRIHPVHVGLGCRQVEATSHELARGHVELADPHRIAPIGGQADQHPSGLRAVRRRAPLRTVPDPFHALGGRQGVQVEQGLPFRGTGGVGLPRCVAPDASRMLGVLPEIRVQPPVFGDQGQPIGSIQSRGQGTDESLVFRGVQYRVGLATALGRPAGGALAADLTEPGVSRSRIVRGGGVVGVRSEGDAHGPHATRTGIRGAEHAGEMMGCTSGSAEQQRGAKGGAGRRN